MKGRIAMFQSKIHRHIYLSVSLAIVISILAATVAPPGAWASGTQRMSAFEANKAATAAAPLPLPELVAAGHAELYPERVGILPAEVASIDNQEGSLLGMRLDANAWQQTGSVPLSVSHPILLSRVQSSYAASGGVTNTLVLTLTVTNNRTFSALASRLRLIQDGHQVMCSSACCAWYQSRKEQNEQRLTI